MLLSVNHHHEVLRRQVAFPHISQSTKCEKLRMFTSRLCVESLKYHKFSATTQRCYVIAENFNVLSKSRGVKYPPPCYIYAFINTGNGNHMNEYS